MDDAVTRIWGRECTNPFAERWETRESGNGRRSRAWLWIHLSIPPMQRTSYEPLLPLYTPPIQSYSTDPFTMVGYSGASFSCPLPSAVLRPAQVGCLRSSRNRFNTVDWLVVWRGERQLMPCAISTLEQGSSRSYGKGASIGRRYAVFIRKYSFKLHDLKFFKAAGAL